MRILLIGNFAPPYEEESLHNLSLLKKLSDDQHQCSVLNISEEPSKDSSFIDSRNYIDFIFKLIRLSLRRDVVHFATKGYLRLGLLKLMTSILIGKILGAKTFITIHSEFFSVAGQMRSPVGGRQTLFTAFTLANKIICSDKDTYDVASMYMRKSNFELIPSFIYIPDEITDRETPALLNLQSKKKVMIFANVKYPSFLFEILKEMLANHPLPSDTGVVISLYDRPTSKLQHAIEEIGSSMKDSIIFIEPDDLKSALLSYSKSDIVLRHMSCDGIVFFEDFAFSIKKMLHLENDIYFPSGLLFIKEGSVAEMCVCIMNTMLCVEAGATPEPALSNSYERIKQLYEE